MDNVEEIKHLKEQLALLEDNAILTLEEEQEEAEMKSRMITQLEFSCQKEEDKFYERIKHNKQTIKKIYIKSSKQHKILEKRKLENKHLYSVWNEKILDKKYDIDMCDCHNGQYQSEYKNLLEINKLGTFEENYKYYGSKIIKHTSQQQKSRWKFRLAQMDEDDPELQLFYIYLRINKENWELYLQNMKLNFSIFYGFK